MASLLISLWILFVRDFLGMVFHNVSLNTLLGNHVLQVMLLITLHVGMTIQVMLLIALHVGMTN